MKEALELAREHIAGNYTVSAEEALAAIDKALAQPEQEPVAWMTTEVTTGTQVWLYKKTAERYQNPPTPLFTTPPQRTWVGLTQVEIEDSYNADYQAQTKAIEAKLKEKNHANGNT